MSAQPFDWEQDDVDPSAMWEGWPTWEQDSRLNCALCETRTRMPGHAVCTYCEYLGVRNYAARGVNELSQLLARYAPWSVWQANNPTEGETVA